MTSGGQQPCPALSVVVPAYNEEKLLAGTLHAIRAGLAGAGYGDEGAEICVADNASTDATPRIAAAAGARVVHEPRRQIARARNAGAAVARGRWLLFVDADTRPSRALLRRARELMADEHCCGAGALIDDVGASLGARVGIGVWNTISRLGRLGCGGFLLCRADAFRELGGFNEELYAAEDVEFSSRLRRWGRGRGLAFHIIRDHRLHTSLRKLDLYSPAELAGMTLRWLRHPRRALRERRFLAAWYDGRR